MSFTLNQVRPTGLAILLHSFASFSSSALTRFVTNLAHASIPFFFALSLIAALLLLVFEISPAHEQSSPAPFAVEPLVSSTAQLCDNNFSADDNLDKCLSPPPVPVLPAQISTTSQLDDNLDRFLSPSPVPVLPAQVSTTSQLDDDFLFAFDGLCITDSTPDEVDHFLSAFESLCLTDGTPDEVDLDLVMSEPQTPPGAPPTTEP
ncbi:hypothetical protein BJ875DRAFT_81350 [Amylocarpus encephaloides]|uniref:Uncharacterized protein n=1 Tax=Amylocarpus encephaloides TaxID=45428 RepID=A0A9P7YET9_9HELO|nr:hypothetical protein BJ875DRAFT_81350 [Amylocarpus encephaloides]